MSPAFDEHGEMVEERSLRVEGKRTLGRWGAESDRGHRSGGKSCREQCHRGEDRDHDAAHEPRAEQADHQGQEPLESLEELDDDQILEAKLVRPLSNVGCVRTDQGPERVPIGMALIADGFGFHIPKGYIYAAMAFSTFIESLNLLSRKAKRKARAKGGGAPTS